MAPARWLAEFCGCILFAATAGCQHPAPGSPRASRLILGYPRDVGPLNVFSGSGDVLLGLVYDKLFEPSPYVPDPGPGLALGAHQVDPLAWDVTIRDGVEWHDGRPFTADDVVFTFEYYRDGPPSRYAHHVSAVPRIEHVVALDRTHVRFTCAYPCPMLPRVTLADVPVLPRHRWQGVTEPRQVDALPIGTGPYRAIEYRADQSYRFRANPRYFRGRPLIDELVIAVIPEPGSMFLALQTGQIDMAGRPVPPELRETLTRAKDVRVVRTTALSIVELRPNYRRTPFDDPEFRRALSLAIDRQVLVDTVLLGQARPGVRGYPHPDSPWTNPALATPFDRSGARRLLDARGMLDRDGDGVREDRRGHPLAFTIKVASSEPTWIRSAEMVARDLAKVGIRAAVVTLESGMISKQYAAQDYDLFISEISAHGAADPDQFVMSHRSGYLWAAGLAYPEMDRLFDAWRGAQTTDARRAALFEMETLFNSRPTSIALYYPLNDWAYRPKAFDAWVDSPGYGIFHKWSLLAAASRATRDAPLDLAQNGQAMIEGPRRPQ